MKVFNEFVAECSKQNDWSSSTLKKFATVKKHIYTFDPNTTFDSWTEKHFNDYIEFLRAEKNMRNTNLFSAQKRKIQCRVCRQKQ